MPRPTSKWKVGDMLIAPPGPITGRFPEFYHVKQVKGTKMYKMNRYLVDSTPVNGSNMMPDPRFPDQIVRLEKINGPGSKYYEVPWKNEKYFTEKKCTLWDGKPLYVPYYPDSMDYPFYRHGYNRASTTQEWKLVAKEGTDDWQAAKKLMEEMQKRRNAGKKILAAYDASKRQKKARREFLRRAHEKTGIPYSSVEEYTLRPNGAAGQYSIWRTEQLAKNL